MSEDENRPVSISGSITDVLGFGKGAGVLVGAIERGIGKALGPWQRQRENRAEISNVEDWAAALNKHGLQITAGEVSLAERTTARLAVDAMRHQEAREAVAIEAVEDFKRIADGREELEPTQPEPEWVDRFWRLAGEVRSDEMRAIWGRVLARQVKGEVSFAARTLDFLSTLSGAEANLIASLAKCVCHYDTAIGVPTNIPQKTCLIRGAPHPTPEDVKMPGRQLADYTEGLATPHLGAIGFYYESGLAHEAFARVEDDQVALKIGGRSFVLRSMKSFGSMVPPLEYSRRPGQCNLGSGEEVTRLGREILSLVDAEPDPAYVNALAKVYDAYGWVLRPAKDLA
ncbi:DUF2806 domain-containing protein [Mesorhizobium salmacidum]|uniref:DUF2806 domain-containing protein n=1 Tax=Mesorhizobium salmacidum TaxID=3015171 RepID=A0ABU8L150_9HYPH